MVCLSTTTPAFTDLFLTIDSFFFTFLALRPMSPVAVAMVDPAMWGPGHHLDG